MIVNVMISFQRGHSITIWSCAIALAFPHVSLDRFFWYLRLLSCGAEPYDGHCAVSPQTNDSQVSRGLI
jgi:hypothetical protein